MQFNSLAHIFGRASLDRQRESNAWNLYQV
ncbi:hypothetical protein MAQ5080_03161 [Marinomonas aquimarina]|uniref:Uncharacterized protein n=1 Tax=Marinomonas aquimarina TaxID=295068 RepID=A0A1A8TQJ5_9GAMM|nr:hypothetical protein MAQ5080_03161 [Marinomonas aquimarina]